MHSRISHVAFWKKCVGRLSSGRRDAVLIFKADAVRINRSDGEAVSLPAYIVTADATRECHSGPGGILQQISGKNPRVSVNFDDERSPNANSLDFLKERAVPNAFLANFGRRAKSVCVCA